MIDNNSICYQGVQRVFRNAMVGFIRERFSLVFPADHEQRLKRPFGEDWEKAASNATQSRQVWGTSTSIKDSYDLLGVNHFYPLFEKYFDKLFSAQANLPADSPKPVKTRFLGNLKTIKDSRDPLSHPVEEEVSYDEAFGLLIDVKQVLTQIGLNKEAAEIAKLADQLDGGAKQVPSIVRHLPPQDSIYLEFVGRGTLLQDLQNCFASADSKRCLLMGDGGKGKSAVAYRFAQELAASSGRFKLVIWLSAKRRKLQDGKVIAIGSPDFTTTDDAVNQLLSEYGASAEDFERPLSERKALLQLFLNDLPAFVIADDIDTVLADSDVVELFTFEIPKTASSVLLTSRRVIPGVHSFTVKGFDGPDADEFIRSRIRLYGLDPALFSKSTIAEIARVTEGSPLYIDDLLRLTRVMKIDQAVRSWSEKKGDEARKYALQREMEQLSVDAKNVLVAAAVADSAISFAELESILEYSDDRLQSALDELQTLFLFPKPSLVEGEQRFEINLNTRHLVRLVEGPSDLYGRVQRASMAVRGQLGDVGEGVIGSLIRQAQLRLNAGRESEAENILLGAIEKHPHAHLHSFLAYVYKRNGRIADARKHFETAAKLKSSKKETFLQWINMEMAEKEWSKAIAVSEKAFKVIPNFYEMAERRVFAKRQAGFDFYRGLHTSKAHSMWREAVADFETFLRSPESLEEGERQTNASLFQSAVICLDMLEDYNERNRYLRQWANEHPDDPNVERQRNYLIQKRGRFAGLGM